jgi:superfamily II DNA helicase RecQ
MKVKVFAIRPESEYLNFDQQQLNGFLDTIEFKKSSTHFIEAEPNYWSVLIYYEEKQQINLVKETAIQEKAELKKEIKISEQMQEADLDLEQLEILKNLKQWRSEKAYKLKISNFLICHNSELINVVVQKPSSILELRRIKGFGDLKSDKYGEDILSILKAS